MERLLTGSEAGTTESLMVPLKIDPANILALSGKPPDPWQSSVLRSAAKQVLLLCSRQAGKSTVAAALALKEALLHAPALVLLLSPTLRQSAELFRKVSETFSALGRPEGVILESVLRIELANGSRILSLPGDEATVRGFSGAALLVIDEAARVPDELYFAVRPMLAVSGGRLVALSTPFGKRGWFYSEWNGEGSWERVRVTADQCPRIPRDFLAEERRSMGSVWYAQEYECQFSDATGTPLYPPEWLEHAASRAREVLGQKRQAKAIGCDPAEGGDKSCWAVVDELGLIHLLSLSTPDTTVIPKETVRLMRDYGVPAERVLFDRGGGGKEHADRLRSMGHNVGTVSFGETPSAELRRGATPFAERRDVREEKFSYRNLRAEMYYGLRRLLDPCTGTGFAIPGEYAKLRRQLNVIPLKHDSEGRIELPPKNKRNQESKEPSLVELIGHSPDELDSLVLAVHALLNKPTRARATAF
jgi:hypothetical protein